MASTTLALLLPLLAAQPAEGPFAGGAPAPTPSLAEPVYRFHGASDTLSMGAAALAISIPSLLAEEIIRIRCPCDPATVNRFDRGAIGNHSAAADAASNVTVLAAMVGPPLLSLADLGKGDAFTSDLTVFAETLLVNGALVEGTKYIAQRPLPRTYAGERSLVHSPGGYRSFYSGHTSTAFAALMATAYTLRVRNGEQVWPWIVAGGLGASVGVERVLAGRHFPSDVIVGAAVGTAVGITVPWLHRVAPRVAVLPSLRGVALNAVF